MTVYVNTGKIIEIDTSARTCTITYGGAQGVPGTSAYLYVAWASDASGTDFTTTFNASLDYIAFKNSSTVIAAPAVGDFTGLWKNYKGATGAAGNMAWKGEWTTATLYKVNELVFHAKTGYGQSVYVCTSEHTSGASTEPEVGASWDTKWDLYSEGGADGAGDVTGPGSTTENKIPQWDSADEVLKDGLTLSTTVGATGSDTALVSEQGIREEFDAAGTGWVAAGETWTYATATTFTITGDKSAKYYPGMRLKLTQNTPKYFIVVVVAVSTNTTVTVYGGSDYSLANAAITSPYYSTTKTPAGFPADPAKWTIETTATSEDSQASPTASTIYNLGSRSIALPIGKWLVSFSVLGKATGTSLVIDIRAGLSTANNSFSENRYVRVAYFWVPSAGAASLQMVNELISCAAATTYYLNGMTPTSSVTAMSWLGSTQTTVIKAVCAYL